MSKSARTIIAAALSIGLSLLVARSAAAERTHTVAPGDTLSYIAELYAVTVGEIVDLNGIPNPDVIFPGDILRVSGLGRGGSDPRLTAGEMYVVQAGDALSAIAARYGVETAALQAANGLADPNFIVEGQTLVIPGQAPDLGFVIGQKPDDPETEGMIDELARAYGVNPGLVKAVAYVESGWDQGARSPAGAMGIMQIMPETALWLESEVFGYELNEDTSAYDNVKAGVRLLRVLLDATGDEHVALASYYQGHGATLSGVLYQDTVGYVRTVEAVRAAFWP